MQYASPRKWWPSAYHLRCCCHNHFEKHFSKTPLYDAYSNKMKVRRWVAPGVRCNVDQSDPISAAGAGHTRHTQSKPRVLIKKSDTSADTCSRDTLVHHSLNFEHKVSVWLLQLINIGSSLSRRHRDNFYKVWRHSLVSNWRNFAK